MPLYGWVVFTAMDFVTGLNLDTPDTQTPLKTCSGIARSRLFWFPVAIRGTFGALWWIAATDHLPLR